MFSPDNHSVDVAKMGPANKEDSERLSTLLHLYYSHLDIDYSEGIFLIGETNLNSKNFKVGDYYIKVIRHQNDKKYVLSFPRIIDFLSFSQIPINHILKNNKRGFITNTTFPNKQVPCYLYVQRYITSKFYSGEFPEFTQCLEILKMLENLKLNGLRHENRSPYTRWNPVHTTKTIRKIIETKNRLDQFDTAVLRNWDAIVEFLDVNRSIISVIQKPDNNLYHYDLHPHNLLFHRGVLKSILDLESFVRIRREVATSFAIFKLGRKSLSKGYVNLQDFQTIIQQFDFDKTNKVTYGSIELLRRITLILQLHYFQNSTIWDADLDKHLLGLKEIKKMFD